MSIDKEKLSKLHITKVAVNDMLLKDEMTLDDARAYVTEVAIASNDDLFTSAETLASNDADDVVVTTEDTTTDGATKDDATKDTTTDTTPDDAAVDDVTPEDGTTEDTGIEMAE